MLIGAWLSRDRMALPVLALAGVAAASGQAPWSLWWLALAGYATAIRLVAAAPGRWSALRRGWAFGAGHFALSLHWITQPFQVDAARDGWMAPFALLGMAAGLALFWALAALVVQGLAVRRRAWGFALALAAAEAARGVVLTGFPWAMPGHIWLGHPPEQLAAILGAGGLTLLTLGLAWLLAGLRPARAGLAMAALAAVWAWGAGRADGPMPPDAGPLIRIVQPNADQFLKWQPDYARMFFERHIELSVAEAPRRPDLIVWPETAVPFLLNDPGYGLQAIVDAVGTVPVALGIQRTDGLRGYNSLAVIGADALGQAEIRTVYDKHHLVPFGEYIPGGATLGRWLGIFSFSPDEGFGYSAGPGPQLLNLPGFGTAQPLICYEAVFPYFQRAVERPDWLLQITNDAWFGDDSGPYQHFALTRLRSIENGLPMIRVANTGISGLIDARGRVVASLDLNQQGFLDVALPGALEPTPYTRVGRWGAVLLWAIGSLLLVGRRYD